MTDGSQEIAGNHSSEQLSDILRLLTTDQMRYIIARQDANSDKEAAEMIGLNPDRVYHWPGYVEQAVKLMAQDGVLTAREILRRNTAKAAAVKVAGLDSDTEQVRQNAATEILDRQLGKPTQKNDMNVSGKVVLLWNPHKPSE